MGTESEDFVPSGSIITNPQFGEPGAMTETGELPGGGGEEGETKFVDPELETEIDNGGEKKDGEGETGKPEDGGEAAPDKIEKMLQDSQAFIGKQSTEIGELRKELEALKASQQQGQQQGQQQQAEPTPQENLRGLVQKFNAQEASLEDVILGAFEAGSKAAESVVEQKFVEREQAANQQRIFGDYASRNPDFAEQLQSGALAQAVQSNPLFNEVSAYENTKRVAAEQQVAALQQELAAVKAEREQAISNGRTQTQKVITNPGSNARVDTGPMSPNDLRAAMVASVKEVRAQEG